MQISVFGLGYVGTVSAACIAESGHKAIAVDPNHNLINEGASPIIVNDVGALVKANVEAHRLRAVVDAREAIHNSNISLVCVETPSRRNGSLDLQFVERVCQQNRAAASYSNPCGTDCRSSPLIAVDPDLSSTTGRGFASPRSFRPNLRATSLEQSAEWARLLPTWLDSARGRANGWRRWDCGASGSNGCSIDTRRPPEPGLPLKRS